MPLRSRLLAGNNRLQRCLVQDAAHVVPGEIGPHVGLIQIALLLIDEELGITDAERRAQSYGKSTAAAVLAFKRVRGIINRAYQSTADNIVGKMTIAVLDDEMLNRERRPFPPASLPCSCFKSGPRAEIAGPVSPPGLTLRLLQQNPNLRVT